MHTIKSLEKDEIVVETFVKLMAQAITYDENRFKNPGIFQGYEKNHAWLHHN